MNMAEHKRKAKRLVILEGPDCGGKTTLLKEFDYGDMAGALRVHHGPYPRLTAAQLPRYYMDSMRPLLDQYEHMLMDRCWLSEPIYGQAFRNGQDRVGTSARRHLERIAMRHGAVVVLCLPPWEKVKEAWLARKGADSEAEYLDRIEQLEQVYRSYERLQDTTDLPVVRYDYTIHRHQIQQLRREVGRVAMPLHPNHSTVGNLDGKIILVGEKPSDHTDQDTLRQFPFCSFSNQGSSRWLTSHLDATGISEADLLWVNASDGLYQIRELYGRPTFALGQAASDALTAADMPHTMVPHPQYHKRFNSSEPYELMSLIQTALKK